MIDCSTPAVTGKLMLHFYVVRLKKRIAIFYALIFSLLGSACAPQPVRIEGTAMMPSFRDGDKVIMNRNVGELGRGDVIMFLYPKDTSKWYFKRIIGLPGEKVEIREGRVFVNGELLDEPYLDPNPNRFAQWFPEEIVPENHYYVLGDNRDNSSDSRYWGTLSKDLIVGKYISTYQKAAAAGSK